MTTRGGNAAFALLTPHDVAPEVALDAIRAHSGTLLLDVDETLYLGNSTEDFIDTSCPRMLALSLFCVLDLIKPWRWTGGAATRDVWRVRLVLTCFPWVQSRWKRRVAALAREFGNHRLLAALRETAATTIVTTAGFLPIVEPLVRELGLVHARIVAARATTFADRRTGKYRMAVDALGHETVAAALVVTDSVDDLALLEGCRQPLRAVWPEVTRRRALRDVYLPGQYLAHVKRPGGGYIFGGIVLEDFALWALASLPLAQTPWAHFAGLGFLLVSFWAVYERGYVDNDRIAARHERAPKLSAAFGLSSVATPRWPPWIWAAACGGIGLLLLRWPQDPTPVDAAIWSGVLLATHACFRTYNRADKSTRVWIYAALQFARTAAFTAVVPVVPIATAALGANVLAKWVPYHVYRLSGADQWPGGPTGLIRLLFFLTNAAMLAIAFGWTIVWNWPALALLGWLVFRARRDLAVVSRRMHWITREDASGRTD